jgi:hypothetical protein
LFFLVFLTACSAGEKGAEGEIWQVNAVSSSNFRVKKGMTMILQEETITFSAENKSFSIPIMKNNDRLVMETDTTRLLFSIEKTTDTTLTLHELYSSFPLTISFIKTTNHKKHKK